MKDPQDYRLHNWLERYQKCSNGVEIIYWLQSNELKT